MNKPKIATGRPATVADYVKIFEGLAAREALVKNLRVGDLVTIRTPQGQEAKGRVVICSGTHAALDMGGKHGRPGVVTHENIVRVSKRKGG